MAGLTEVEAQLAELRENQVALGKQLNQVLADHAEIKKMVGALQDLVATNTHGIPTLAFVLPVVSKSLTGKINPMRLVRNQYRLYFLCAHTHQLAPCGPKGKGYKITMTKQWVLDAAPVLRVGLVLLKVALMASGLPLPVPDFCTMLVDTAMHSKYLDAVLKLVSNPPDDVASNAEHVMDQALDAVAEHDYSDYKGPLAVVRLQKGSRKAYEIIKESLEAGKDGVNIALTCGLRQVTYRGKTAWVLDNDFTEQAWKNAVESSA
jgi:hypothetical protein